MQNLANDDAFSLSCPAEQPDPDLSVYVRLNPDGSVKETRDARGNTTWYEHDSHGNLSGIHFEYGDSLLKDGGAWIEYKAGVRYREHRVFFAVTADGDLGCADFNGFIRVHHLDGSITKIFPNQSQITINKYDRVEATTSVGGVNMFYEYDGSGCLSTVRLDGGNIMRREREAWVEYRNDQAVRLVHCDLSVSENGDFIWLEQDNSANVLHLDDSISNHDASTLGAS